MYMNRSFPAIRLRQPYISQVGLVGIYYTHNARLALPEFKKHVTRGMQYVTTATEQPHTYSTREVCVSPIGD